MIETFVISLKSRPDRLEQFQNNWKDILEYKIFAAIGESDLPNQVYSSFPNWLDPLMGRGLTNGEIGCFLSHYTLWLECIKLNRPILILEDDARCVNPESFSNVVFHSLKTIAKKHADVVYLGYTEMDTSIGFDDQLLVVGYPYLTSSYIISPKACKLLTQTDIINTIIPVDEYMALMTGADIPEYFKSEGLTHMKDKLERFSKIKSLAFRVNQVEQLPREQVGSDVEPKTTGESAPTMYTFTYASDRDKAKILEESAVGNGYNIYILGTRDEWKGNDLSNSTGGMQKLKGLYSHLKEHFTETENSEDFVLFVDGYDTFINARPEVVYQRFLESGKDILFASELSCWPSKALEPLWDSLAGDNKSKFLNSGAFLAKIGPLLQILRETEMYADSYDDQLFMHRIFLKSKGLLPHDEITPVNCVMDIDYYNTIFQCLNGEEDAVKIDVNGIIYNKNTKTFPVILHGNGPKSVKDFFKTLVSDIDARNNSLGDAVPRLSEVKISNPLHQYFTFADIHQHPVGQTDFVALKFLTREGCNEIIRKAEEAGVWAPEPGDNYPGQEQRLSRFWPEMFDVMNEYLREHVYYHFERHWKPMVIPGLRDIFVIKYSMDKQRSLDLHHDASLVSMSIKLNEEYEGGELYFPRQGFSNKNIPVGTALAWPSQVTHPHECTTLTSGTKYSLTIWTARIPEEVVQTNG